MNFQNRNNNSQNSSDDFDRLKKIDESKIEKPDEFYTQKNEKDTVIERDINPDINPTVTFYKEDSDSKIENIKIIDSENNEEDINELSVSDNLISPSRRDFINKPSRKKKIIIYLIFFLALGCIFLFIVNSSKNKKANNVKQTSAKVVTTVPVVIKKINRSDFQVFEKTIGSISNLDINSVSSEVSGLVKKINVDIGDTVKKGEVIAVIDSDELKNNVVSQEAEIKRIGVLLSDAKKTQNRYKQLIKDGFVSQADMDSLSTNIKSYQEQLVNAKAVLANSKIKLQKSVIRAPQSGVIQQRYVALGAFVSVSTPIVDIVNNQSLTVIASMPESFSYRLKKGQDVTLKITGTDIELKSKVKELKPVIDEQSRSVSLIIDIPKNNYNLKPGGTLEVYISMENKKNVVIVPESAVIPRVAGKVVYTVNEDKTVNEVIVQTGVYQDGSIEITSGLKGDETIVTDGASFLSDKASVSYSESSQ